MQTKQTITIIGTSGNIGSLLAQRLSKGNFRLLLCTDKQQKTEKLLQRIKSVSPEADAEIVGCPFDATWESDIIIVGVRFDAQEEIAGRIRAVANQKIVISITTTANDVSDESSIPNDKHAAEALQRMLPNSKIISAVITGIEDEIASPDSLKQFEALIAGDDQVALETVADLLKTANVNPIKSGRLTLSMTLEKLG